MEDHSKTQVEAAQVMNEFLASQQTASASEAVLVTHKRSGDLCRSQDLHPVNQMDDTNVTDPVNESNPVNEANQVNKAKQANEANQVKQGSGNVKQKGGNSAAKGTTDTPMKGKEQEAALLLNLSKTPPLTKASFTTEDWDRILAVNPLNMEEIPPLLSRPPQARWSKALQDASQIAWT